MPRKKETRGRKPLDLTPKKKQKHINDRQNAWKKEHNRMISIRYNIETDKDILEMLDSVPNKADYIRQLIKKDIIERKKKEE